MRNWIDALTFVRCKTALKLGTAACALLLSSCSAKRIIDIKLAGKVDPKGDNQYTTAYLSIDKAPTYTFINTAVTQTRSVTLTVKNIGRSPAMAIAADGSISAPFSFKGGSYPGTGGTCGVILEVGASCSIVVDFSPTVLGSFSDQLEIDYDDGNNLVNSQLDLNGTGEAPAARLSISNGAIYNYGTQAVGSATDHTFTVSNTGNYPAASIADGAGLAAPFDWKGGTYPGIGGTCAATLAMDATCTVVVSFSPASVSAFSGTLVLDYDDGSAAQSSIRALQGTGALADLSISDALSFDFGSLAVGGTYTKIFTVTNAGAFAATSLANSALAAPFGFSGGSGYPGTGGTCGTTLAASATCTIVVSFSPAAIGSFSGTLELSYNDGQAAQTTSRPITGAGSLASLTISDDPTFDYGLLAVGSTNSKTFTVTNSGEFTAASVGDGGGLASPFHWKGGAYPGTGGTCGATLAAGATCTILVDFSPTTTGAASDSVALSYNDGQTTQSVSRALTGTGALAQLVISDGATYDYGNQAPLSTTSKTFSIANTGALEATALDDALGLAAPFNWAGGAYPGTAGTCSTTLAAGGSCTIVVDFSPDTTGVFSGGIEVSYDDGQSSKIATRSLIGTGAVAVMTISEAPNFDYGSRALGSTTSKTFTVSNVGITATSITDTGSLTAPFSWKGGSYPGTGGTCSTTLSAGATCTLVTNFSPTAVGEETGTLDLSYDDGVATQHTTRDLLGTGVIAVLTISDGATYDYGTQTIGATASKTFTVTNSGTLNATSLADAGGLAAPFEWTGGSYPGTGGTCGTSLAVSDTCTLAVDFSPTASGPFNDSIDLSYNDGQATQTAARSVSGAGDVAVLEISDGATFDYGNQAAGSATSKTFTVTNTGGGPAASLADGAGLSAPFDWKDGTYPGTGGTCSTTLAIAASCTVVVDFSPTASGAFSDSIVIDYNDGLFAQSASRNVQGSGALAALTLSDSPTYDYGSVLIAQTGSKTFTVTNSGWLSATAIADAGALGSPFQWKGGTYPGTGGSCGSTLAASAACTVVVDFTPTAGGAASGTLSISYNDGAGTQTLSEGLSGTGLQAALTISDSPSYDFGGIVYGQTAERSFTITNTGNYAASMIADGSGLAAPFRYKGSAYPGTGGDCGTTLAVSASCTVVLEYAPVSAGSDSDTLLVNYNDGAAAQSVSEDVAGLAATPASLQISSSPTYGYGNVDRNLTLDHTFTVTNSGGVSATSVSDAGSLAAPFNWKGGTYPGTGGTCGSTLAASATCTLVITYSPTTLASHTGTARMSYHDGVNSQSLDEGLAGTGVNTVPVANALSITVYKGTSGNPFTVSATDINSDALSYSIVAAPSNGTVGSQDGDTNFTYTPTAGFVGSDSFTFRANDGTGNSNTATVSVTVNTWWNASWKRRRKITFANSGSTTNLTNFPVMIKIDASRVDYAQTQDAGQDIRFVDADDNTLLSHEIETWNEAGSSIVWVKVPQIDASSNADFIYMYYGNGSASDGQAATSVWSNGFLAVYHMKQDPNSTNVLDSTANAYDLALAGTGTTPSLDVTNSSSGNSLSFPGGSGQYLINSANYFNGLGSFTISFSLKASAVNTGDGFFATDAQSNAAKTLNVYHATSSAKWSMGYIGGTPGTTYSSAINTATTSWQTFDVTWTSGGYPRMYFNGVADATTGTTRTGTTSATFVRIGQGATNYAAGTVFNGLIDEVRISNVARSADWIAATDLTNNDASYCGYGAEITIP